MGYTWQVFVAVGLAADAFAVAMANGAHYRRESGLRLTLSVGLAFGFFQGAMLVLGHGAGLLLYRALHVLGHWLGPAVIIAIGLHMIAGGGEGQDRGTAGKISAPMLLLQAAATSIDAFAVGVGLAVHPVAILQVAGIVGGVTLCLCMAGVLAGRWFGLRFPQKTGWLGGALLLIAGLGMLV